MSLQSRDEERRQRLAERRERFREIQSEKERRDQEKVLGIGVHHQDRRKAEYSVISAMLSPEAIDRRDPVHARHVAKLQANFMEETSVVKKFLELKGELKLKFRVAGWAAIMMTHLQMQAAKRRRGLLVRRIPKRKASRQLSAHGKAKIFIERVKKGPIDDTSPMVQALRAKQEEDLKTAESHMYKSGELTRLLELRARKHLDDIEIEVMARLEAKLQGMIFAAELDRKDREIDERKKFRLARIEENEKKFAQTKLILQLQREKKMRKFLAPFRKAEHRARRLSRRVVIPLKTHVKKYRHRHMTLPRMNRKQAIELPLLSKKKTQPKQTSRSIFSISKHTIKKKQLQPPSPSMQSSTPQLLPAGFSGYFKDKVLNVNNRARRASRTLFNSLPPVGSAARQKLPPLRLPSVRGAYNFSMSTTRLNNADSSQRNLPTYRKPLMRMKKLIQSTSSTDNTNTTPLVVKSNEDLESLDPTAILMNE